MDNSEKHYRLGFVKGVEDAEWLLNSCFFAGYLSFSDDDDLSIDEVFKYLGMELGRIYRDAHALYDKGVPATYVRGIIMKGLWSGGFR